MGIVLLIFLVVVGVPSLHFEGLSRRTLKDFQNTNYIRDRWYGRLFYGTPGSQGSLFNKRPRCLELFWKMHQIEDDADDGEFSSGMEQEMRRSSYCCFNLMN